MSLITLCIVGYILLGWLTVLRLGNKEKSFTDQLVQIVIFGLMLALCFYIGRKLSINQEILVLLGVALGAVAYRAKFEFYDSIPFILCITTIGYFWFHNGFFHTLYLVALSSVVSFIVQVPLVEMPDTKTKATTDGSLMIAYTLSVVSFGNVLLIFFLRGL